MGYCYSFEGLLCCDICGKTGNVRKVKCPFGWCQSIAACPDCRKSHSHEFGKAAHQALGCEKYSKDFDAKERLKDQLMASGQAVRCSALSSPTDSDPERVHVLFRTASGACIGFFMATATYHAYPLLTPTVPDDYRKHGELTPAPSSYYAQDICAA